MVKHKCLQQLSTEQKREVPFGDWNLFRRRPLKETRCLKMKINHQADWYNGDALLFADISSINARLRYLPGSLLWLIKFLNP
jgi:hypothetical protein